MNIEDYMKPPRIDKVKRALFIQPHPDDNEIGAGGTIARLVDLGCEVYELTVSDGRYGMEALGIFDYTHDEVIKMRHDEACKAMELLGMKNAGFLGFSDKIPDSVETVAAAIAKVLEEIQPEMVFAVDPKLKLEMHPDHLKVSQALIEAIRITKFTPEALAYYFTDDPNTDFNVTDYYDKKMKAIACHASQVDSDFAAFLEAYYRKISESTVFEHAERFRVFAGVHTHCWTLPLEHVAY